jgi:hypothetical protein
MKLISTDKLTREQRQQLATAARKVRPGADFESDLRGFGLFDSSRLPEFRQIVLQVTNEELCICFSLGVDLDDSQRLGNALPDERRYTPGLRGRMPACPRSWCLSRRYDVLWLPRVA